MTRVTCPCVPQALAATALRTSGGGASAQTVLTIGCATAKDSHHGAGATMFGDEIAQATVDGQEDPILMFRSSKSPRCRSICRSPALSTRRR